MAIKKVFVCGAGLMGSGITQVCAQAGYEVIMRDVAEKILKKAMDSIAWSVGKFIEKGALKEPKETIIGRVKTTLSLEDAKGADLVIEAVPEEPGLKRETFAQLDSFCPPETIFATNTSAIPISLLASATKRPEKFVGTHFFSPVPMMRLVEVIKGLSTSAETVEIAKTFVKSLGKEAVEVKRDVAGFLMNRIGISALLEAIRLFEQGVGSAEDIDAGMRLGYGWRMGPLETADMTGLDVMMNAAMAIYNDTGDPKFNPPTLLRRMVIAGQHGQKTGVGFYEYKEGQKIPRAMI